jgi:hypothetical protein
MIAANSILSNISIIPPNIALKNPLSLNYVPFMIIKLKYNAKFTIRYGFEVNISPERLQKNQAE